MAGAVVLLNRRSGSASSRAAIMQAFAEAGLPCHVRLLTRRVNVQATVDEAVARGAVVVAAGGDGTVGCVAGAMARHPGVAFGVLPVGTLNHFAKDIGLPLTLEGAAQAIAAGQTRTIDAGEVNGRLFVNNSSIGFYPGMVLQRERLKKVGLNKWLSLLVASFGQFVRFRHLNVCVTLGTGERLMRTTPFVFVGNNEYAMEGAAAGTRARLDTGRLYLYMAPGATRLSLLRLTLAALRNRVKESPHFESLCVEEFSVQPRRKKTYVALDGEVVRVKGALRYRTRPGALRVLAP